MAVFLFENIDPVKFQTKMKRLKRETFASTMYIFDLKRATNDESFYRLINIIRNCKNHINEKFGVVLMFGLSNIDAVTKYSVFDIISVSPKFVSLAGKYSNRMVGTFLDDSEFTGFGEYITSCLDKNEIEIDVTNLSENSFMEVSRIVNTPMLSFVNFETKSKPFLHDYQNKIIAEQRGEFFFVFSCRPTEKNKKKFESKIEFHIINYGGDSVHILCENKKAKKELEYLKLKFNLT